jgi:hypothetical protein
MSRPGFLLLSFLAAIPLFATEPPQSAQRRPIAEPVAHESRDARAPQIASDGSRFFGVWGDEMNDISGARFDSDGDLVDSSEFPVVTTWHGGEYPAVTWNGSEYVVLGSAGPLGVFPVRVTTDGEVKPGPGAIPDLFPQQSPSLVWNGSLYAYAAVGGYNALRVAFLDPNLSVVKTYRLSENINVRRAQIATDGSGFLAVWEIITDREDIALVQPFDATGQATRPAEPIRIIPLQPGGVLGPSVCWNGSHYFVVMTAGSVEGALISGDGTLERTFTISKEDLALDASIAWDGFAHLITWNQKVDPISFNGPILHRPAAVLTSATGDVLTNVVIPYARSFRPGLAAIASNGSVFHVFWFGERFIIRSTGDARLQKHFSWTTKRFQSQRDAVLQTGSSNLLAAWIEEDAMYAARLSKRGESLDGGGIPIATGYSYEVRLAYSHGVYLIIWRDGNGNLSGMRLAESGERLDSVPFVLETSPQFQIVAGRDDGFLVVWSRWTAAPPPGHIEIVASNVPARGPVESRLSEPLFASALNQTSSAVLWMNNAYTLIWRQQVTQPCYGSHCPAPQFETRASVLDLNGHPLLTRTLLSTGTVFDVQRTTDGTLMLLYWSQAAQTQQIRANGELVGDLHSVPVTYSQMRLATTPAGFLLVGNNRFMQLDRAGAPVSSETAFLDGDDSPRVSDVAGDGVRVWVAYSAEWHPRPTTTAGVARAFLYSRGPRTRIASH